MAYQNVGTPKFYINVIEYLASTGLEIHNKFRTLPVEPSYAGDITVPTESQALLTSDMEKFIFTLGHNMVSGSQIVLEGGIYDEATINALPVSYSGFSLLKYTLDLTKITVDGDVGSFVVGNTYTMPHSPDLNLSMTREYGGIKETTTKGGSTLSNDFGSKPPAWGSLGAWELGGTAAHAKSGRRVWDLSFSYLQDSAVFPDNSSLTNYEIEGYSQSDNPTLNTLLDGDDFYSQVIHKTNGGQLPFIFQPDNSNNNPDQFAICKFDSGFKFDQVANGVYNVKLKIREVW